MHIFDRFNNRPDAQDAEVVRLQLLPTVDLDQHLAQMEESRISHFRDGDENRLRQVRKQLDAAAATALTASAGAAARGVTTTVSVRDLLGTGTEGDTAS